MRYPRFKGHRFGQEESYFHLISRTVNGEWLFGEVEKEMLRKHIWLVAEYCGLEVLTYAIMRNHFHVLARVPKKERIADAELLRRYKLLHSGISPWQELEIAAIERMLVEDGDEAEAWRQRQLKMMGDISPYMQLLKQRFSIWFNRTHNRFGTLWAERFKSVLLESGLAVRRTAAYIDLNAVRANLVVDPKDYRFCGYAQAMAGDSRARAGMTAVVGAAEWTPAHAEYRLMLFQLAANPSAKGASISAKEKDAVVTQKGSLTLAAMLGCRCRYLTDGAVLGSKAFVLEQITAYRRKSGRGQRTDARGIPADSSVGELAVFHKLIGESFT